MNVIRELLDLKYNLLQYKKWIASLLCVHPDPFIRLSPPFRKKQVLLNKRDKSVIKLTLRNDIDLHTFGEIFIQEDYNVRKIPHYPELKTYYDQLCEKKLKPLIMDCGANIGLASQYFSQVFPHSCVVAVEPDAANVELARLNTLGRDIVVLQAGVASETMKGRLSGPGEGMNNNEYTVSPDDSGDIPLVSINSLLEDPKYKDTAPFIIKIDIEGSEKELFSKNVEWMDKFPLLIIELHDWKFPKQQNSRNFLSQISKLNRDFIYSGQNIFSVKVF